jgi:hypothetical protein
LHLGQWLYLVIEVSSFLVGFLWLKLVSITAKALRSSEGLIIDSEQAFDFKGTITGTMVKTSHLSSFVFFVE